MKPNAGYLLGDCSRLLRRSFDERVRCVGLTAPQARLLLSLDNFPLSNQAFFADRLEVEPITLTRIADRMEEAGLLERVPDPADRRARLLQLTEKGRGLVARVRRIVDGMVEDMLEGIDDLERDQFVRLLGMISDNLVTARSTREAANG